MSTVYNLEPPTKGKVTLKTTIGDLDIELWPKEAPKAVRNFVQLSLEGAYDGVIFHRVIKDFMAQTGDPTGTGEGGESVYGQPFKDEFHSRLRFNHRGLVACANRNQPHTNGAQFFITLDKCEWLDKQNTIFGKIVGDTIYNLLRLNDLEVDEATDQPADPPIIKSVDVQWNPFDDIVPRTTPEERRAQAEFKKAEETRKERKGRKRNLALLSFGDVAEEEEAHLAAEGTKAKIKSAHEVLEGDAKLLRPEETPEEVLREQQQRAAALSSVQGKLKAAAAAAATGGAGGSSSSDDEDDDDDDDDGRGGRRGSSKQKKGAGGIGAAAVVAERVRAAADKASSAKAAREAAAAAAAAGEEQGGRSRSRSRSRGRRSDSSSSGDSRSRSRSKGRDGAAAAAAAGGDGSIKPRSKEDELYQVKEKQQGGGRLRVTDEVKDGELLKAFELSRQKYKTRKQQVGNRQKQTLDRLAAFTNKLRSEQQRQQKKDKAAASAEPSAADAAATATAAPEAGAEGQQQQQEETQGDKPAAVAGDDEAAYDGKVRQDIDHRSYMPAAWRVDDYLNQQSDDEGDLSSLRQHKLQFSKAPGADAMARSDNLDDYVVFDPLLESAKGKFSRAAQKEKKKQTQWAGRGHG